MALLETLKDMPDSVDAFRQMIADLDTCFLYGFVGRQYKVLAALSPIFVGTPLQQRIQDCVQALAQGTFTETHFVTLAAVRGALQGTMYDVLRQQALTALGRTASAPDPGTLAIPAQTEPLLDSARHWLMELAIAGFARLGQDAVTAFSPTLAQLRANLSTVQHAALLTGFLDELLKALPVESADRVPLLRWCDLWSSAMVGAVGLADSPPAVPVSGDFYSLGVELRQHSRMASVVVYAVLLNDGEPRFVRQTWSSYKATAIQGDEIWLLFPEAQTLLLNLLQGKALIVHEMPVLPSGDLFWQADAVETGKKYKPLEIALEYCVIGKPLKLPPVPPLARHPIQLAEPVALSKYRVEDGALCLDGGSALPLETRRGALPASAVDGTAALFGLLRYDGGKWSVQALMAGKPAGKYEFVGEAGAELLKKPPKTSTVSILQERASRLLRK